MACENRTSLHLLYRHYQITFLGTSESIDAFSEFQQFRIGFDLPENIVVHHITFFRDDDQFWPSSSSACHVLLSTMEGPCFSGSFSVLYLHWVQWSRCRCFYNFGHLAGISLFMWETVLPFRILRGSKRIILPRSLVLLPLALLCRIWMTLTLFLIIWCTLCLSFWIEFVKLYFLPSSRVNHNSSAFGHSSSVWFSYCALVYLLAFSELSWFPVIIYVEFWGASKID